MRNWIPSLEKRITIVAPHENFSFYPVSVLFVGFYIISLHDMFYEGSYGLGSVKSFSHFCLQSQGWMKSVSNGGILIAL